jgi:hypothetical protein
VKETPRNATKVDSTWKRPVNGKSEEDEASNREEFYEKKQR